MRLALLTLIFVFILGSSACSLIVSTSGLSGGTEPSDGGAIDSGGATEPDGGASAEASTGDSGAAFCASLTPKPLFCDDFDDGRPFNPADWIQVQTQSLGTLSVDQGRARSAPASLLTTVPQSDGDLFPPAWARHAAGTNGVRIEVDVYVEHMDEDTNGARILTAQFGDGTIPGFYVVQDGRGGVNEEWKDGGQTHNIDHGEKPLDFANRWFHVALRATRGGALSVVVDGQEYADGSNLQGPTADGQITGIVGLYYPQVTGTGWSVRYDNLIIDDP